MLGGLHRMALRVSSFEVISSFLIRISSFFRLAFAQKHHANRGRQHENTDDLQRKIVIAKKQRTDVPHIVNRRCRERRESLLRGFKMPDRKDNLNEQNERHSHAARGGEPIDSMPFFGLQIKKHDNKKEKHHYCARVNQNLNDPDKVRVERHEQCSESQKRNDEAEGTGNWIAIENNRCAKDQRHQRKNPEEEWRHRLLE